MCAPLLRRMSARAAAVTVVAAAAACGAPERTGTSFCRQLAREIPAIAQPAATPAQARALVERYERLTDRAPLDIEEDLRTLTALFRLAGSVDPGDPKKVQELAAASYRANRSALDVRDWVMSTCAVDISTGLTIAPPRTAPPATATTLAAPATSLP